MAGARPRCGHFPAPRSEVSGARMCARGAWVASSASSPRIRSAPASLGLPTLSGCESATSVGSAFRTAAHNLDSLARSSSQGKQGRPLLVGLVGPPASGKSSAAEHIVSLTECSAVMLPMDGFHLYMHELRQLDDFEHAFAMRGSPWTFSPSRLADTLQRIREGCDDLLAPSFDHSFGDPIERAFVIPAGTPALLVEGNYLHLPDGGWQYVGAQLDEIWYLDASLARCRERLVRRHVETGVASSTEGARKKVEQCDGPNADLIAQHADRCSVRVPSIDSFG